MECQADTLISVIVPCYNTKETLFRDCLYSLHQQSYHNLEIIVVNDGSDAEYASMYDNVLSGMNDNEMSWICYHKMREGVSTARNFGIEKSNGEYICFLDSDDYLNIDFISILLEMMQKTGVPIAHCEQKQTNGTDKNWMTNITEMPAYHIFHGVDVFKNCNGYVTPKMYSKKFIEQERIRFRVEMQIGEDLLFVANMCEKALVSVGTKAQLYYYRINPWNTTSKMTASGYEAQTEAFQYLLTIPCIAKDTEFLDREIRIQSYCKLKLMTATIREKKDGWYEKYKNYRSEYCLNTAKHIVKADGIYKWLATKSLELSAGCGMAFLITYEILKSLYITLKNSLAKLKHKT